MSFTKLGDGLVGLVLNFLSTWGDPYYLGLTGLEVIGREGETIDVNMDMVSADPQDLHVLPGYESDDRTLDKYVLFGLYSEAIVSYDLQVYSFTTNVLNIVQGFFKVNGI